MKPDTISVAERTPCFLPENRDIFDQIIEITVSKGGPPDRGESTRLRNLIKYAANVCGTCPAREQCLDVHGRDYRLGVIGGASDAQRQAFFEAESA